MRNVNNETLDLFVADPGRAEQAFSEAVVHESEDGKKSERLARDFVRWCCNFGADFRNSPDLVNLRYWAQKHKVKLKGAEEDEVLVESRRLFLKKLEQSVGKAEPVPPLSAPGQP